MNTENTKAYVTEIAEVMNEKYGWTKRDAKDAATTVFEAIKEILMDGKSVGIKGFGSFDLTEAEAREFRNPATGEIISKPVRIIPKFKISATLKKDIMDTLNG